MSSGKADLSLQDINRNTALHLACSKVTTSQSGDDFYSLSIKICQLVGIVAFKIASHVPLKKEETHNMF